MASETDSLRERRELGIQQIADMISPEQAEVIRQKIASGTFGADMMAMTMDHCYADVWSRPGLSRRDRSLVTLGILMAQKAGPEMVFQTKMALKNGITPDEIEEIILQALTYVGFSAANLASAVMQGVLEEEKGAD